MRKIRPIPRRGSTSKGFDDHYHVEGPNPKTYTFCKYNFFLKRLDQSRGEGLHSKENLHSDLSIDKHNMNAFWKRRKLSPTENLPLWALISFSNFSKYVLMIKKRYDVMRVHECMDAQNPYFSFLSFHHFLYCISFGHHDTL